MIHSLTLQADSLTSDLPRKPKTIITQYKMVCQVSLYRYKQKIAEPKTVPVVIQRGRDTEEGKVMCLHLMNELKVHRFLLLPHLSFTQ